jgi:hypothetical protein
LPIFEGVRRATAEALVAALRPSSYDRRWAIDLDGERVPILPAIARKLRVNAASRTGLFPPCRLQGLEVKSYYGEKAIVILNAR